MKFLCDFDGVLTDITAEARLVYDIFCTELRNCGGLPAARVDALLQQTHATLAAAPQQYGWREHGRIAAYANEDAFMANVGLANGLDDASRTVESDAALLVQRLRQQGVASYSQLAQQAYQTMVDETRAGKRQPVEPEAVETLQRLLHAGHQIVIVSNSSTDRILDLLGRCGLRPDDHGANPAGQFRVRGDARKFHLDAAVTNRGFTVGDYWIDAARPTYEAIIRDEQPSVAIGDVFSLDLGMPYFLAGHEPAQFDGLHLWLRQRPYTPGWSRAFITDASAKHCEIRLLPTIGELATRYC
ncbi:MAG: hypothetical protein HY696_00250 [Deltaproteobacteria bacterium]|nr:hypothetical protein [Deltaproteobacteria bacterium]